jgi:hypothetical protein
MARRVEGKGRGRRGRGEGDGRERARGERRHPHVRYSNPQPYKEQAYTYIHFARWRLNLLGMIPFAARLQGERAE